MRTKRSLFSLFLAYVAQAIIGSATANAQHPIDVQRMTAKGDYFAALATYDKMAKRTSTTDSVVAAARSAWALGLPDRAIEEYERALRNEKLEPTERARLFFSRGIIEYQEGRYQVAVLFAEKSISLLREPGPLRSKVRLLWGESLYRLGSFGAAEAQYEKALDEAAPSDLAEAHYLLGECRLKLGKEEDARGDLESIPMEHERAPQAMRSLAQIAISQGHYDQAGFWLETGRKKFPESYLDSWVDYAMVTVAINRNEVQKVRDIRKDALNKYPPSDPWLSLLDAAAEGYEWKYSVKRN